MVERGLRDSEGVAELDSQGRDPDVMTGAACAGMRQTVTCDDRLASHEAGFVATRAQQRVTHEKPWTDRSKAEARITNVDVELWVDSIC